MSSTIWRKSNAQGGAIIRKNDLDGGGIIRCETCPCTVCSTHDLHVNLSGTATFNDCDGTYGYSEIFTSEFTDQDVPYVAEFANWTVTIPDGAMERPCPSESFDPTPQDLLLEISCDPQFLIDHGGLYRVSGIVLLNGDPVFPPLFEVYVNIGGSVSAGGNGATITLTEL